MCAWQADIVFGELVDLAVAHYRMVSVEYLQSKSEEIVALHMMELDLQLHFEHYMRLLL